VEGRCQHIHNLPEQDRRERDVVFLRFGGLLALALLLVLATVLGTMRMGWWNPSYEEVRARQATPPSRFIDVGDVTLHMRDEGDGPTIIMLHSSMSNLRIWDDWADILKEDYRVVRFDWPPYGLSIDPEPSTGMAGVVELLEAFVEQQQLDDFVLVGSSSGATVSVLYAAKNPEKVRGLALSVLPLQAPPDTDFSQVTWGLIWLHQNVIPNYNSRAYYRRTLGELYGVPERLTDETVDWYYETNNIPGGFERVSDYYQANRASVWARGAGDEAGRISVPILLQWGDADPVLPVEMAAGAVADFSGTQVEVIHYPYVGHYPMLELPDQTGRDLKAFIDRLHASESSAGVAGLPGFSRSSPTRN
jgi:pimeloyl-ACP methyl ester carboxylesterase